MTFVEGQNLRYSKFLYLLALMFFVCVLYTAFCVFYSKLQPAIIPYEGRHGLCRSVPASVLVLPLSLAYYDVVPGSEWMNRPVHMGHLPSPYVTETCYSWLLFFRQGRNGNDSWRHLFLATYQLSLKPGSCPSLWARRGCVETETPVIATVCFFLLISDHCLKTIGKTFIDMISHSKTNKWGTVLRVRAWNKQKRTQFWVTACNTFVLYLHLPLQ